MLGGGRGTQTPGSAQPPRRGNAGGWGQVGVGSHSPGTPLRSGRRGSRRGRGAHGSGGSWQLRARLRFPGKEKGVQGWEALKPAWGRTGPWGGCGEVGGLRRGTLWSCTNDGICTAIKCPVWPSGVVSGGQEGGFETPMRRCEEGGKI